MSGIRVVDAHMHLGAPFTLFTHGWELPDILALMDRLQIDRAYSAHHLWLAGYLDRAREESIRAYEESCGRIPFLAVHDPRLEAQSLAAMDACSGCDGLIGIKIHPSFHGIPGNDERYAVVWDYASRHRLPILTHSWSETDNPVQKLSLPRLFEKHIQEHPEVPFVLGHAGGPGNGQHEAIRLAQNYPNVYLDLAGDIFLYDLLPILVKAVGAHRVLYGSDQPWIDPRAGLARVYLADLDDVAKRMVLGENALRVFEPHLLTGGSHAEH